MEIDPPSTPSTRSRSSVLSLISTFLCHPRLRKSRSHADVLNHEGASDGRKSKLSSEKSPRPSAGLARPVSALLSSNYTTSHPTPQTHYHTAHDPNADVFPTSHPQGRFSPLPPTPFSGFPKAPSSSSLNNINTSNAYGARGTSPERRYGSPASYKAGAGGGYFGSDEGGGGEVREGYNEEAYDTSDDPRRHRKAELDNLSLAEVESVIHASRTRSETGDHVRQILSRTGSLARSVDSFGFVTGAGLGRNDSNPRSILGRNSSLPSRDSHGVHGHAGQTSLGRNGSMPRSDLGRSKSGKSGAEESISEESEVVFVPRKDKGKAKALDQDAIDGFSFENENPNPNSLQALVREEEVHTDHSAFTSPDASPAVGATVPLPISTKPTPVLPTTNSNGNITTVPSPTSLPKLQTALPVPASAPASAISPSVSIRRLPPEPNAPSKASTPIQPSPMRALPNPNGPSTAQVYERALSPAISSFSHTSSSQPYPLAHDDAPSPPPRMPSLLSQYQHSHSHSQSQSLSHSHSRASSTTGSRRMLPSPPPMPSTTPFSTSSHGSSYGNGGGHSTSLSQSFSAFSPSPLSNGAVGGGNGFVRTDLARDDYDPRMRDNLMSSPVYPRPVQGRGVAPEVQDY